MGESNDLFTRILASGPSQSTLFLLLTEMKKQGQIDDVIRECAKALSVYPDAYRIRRLLAECYLEAGSIDQSEKEMEKVISHIEHLIPVFKIQAENYERQGRVKEAAEALKKYLSYRPNDAEALALQDRIKPEKEKPTAEVSETLKDVLEEGEDTDLFAELATPTLAEIYYNQGLIQEAINTYRTILSAEPGNEAARQRLKELTVLTEGKEEAPIPGENIVIQRKKKMLGILEGWLARIQESSRA